MSYLESLFTKYGTDKGIWGYTPYYEEALGKQRLRVQRVLEIGICGHRDIPNNVVGASLFVWRDYFPEALITGLDNDSRFIFHDQDRIGTHLIDAYDGLAMGKLFIPKFEAGVRFDFICDDAVHDPDPQMHLFRTLWPMVAPGGVYAIEEACPYKVPDGDLIKHMVQPLVEQMPGVDFVKEGRTHKDERLLLFHKSH